jgi:hypothetical protein
MPNLNVLWPSRHSIVNYAAAGFCEPDPAFIHTAPTTCRWSRASKRHGKDCLLFRSTFILRDSAKSHFGMRSV